MVHVEVVLPGVLADDAGGARQVDVIVGDSAGSGARISHVLEGLSLAHPLLGRRLRDESGAVRRYVNLFLNGDDVRFTGGLETPVRDGSTLLVLPNVAGG